MSPEAGGEADVVVVGAGPVGLLVALLLGRKGWQVELLERHARPYDRPRAVHLDHESARVLQHAGVMASLAARAEVMDSYLWRNAAGEALLWLDGAAGSLTPSGWPASLMFFQPDLERLLAAAVDGQRNVRVRRGYEVFGLENALGRVRVGATGLDGRARSIDAGWVVGCDGAGSRVRQLAGIDQVDFGYRGTWIVADVRPADPGRWTPLNVQICDPARPTTAVSGGPGRRRFEFLRLPGDPSGGPGTAELIWRLLAPWDLTPANAVLERHASYTFGSSMVASWSKGRILLAGDAAHQMPPFAGQGLCAGVRDAANVAWKLDLVLAGKAPVTLVEAYGSERAPQVRAELDFSVELGKLLCVVDPAEAAARDESLRALGALGPQPLPERPSPGPGIWQDGDPHAGTPCLQATVPVGGRRLLLDDVTGGGWRLLDLAGSAASSGLGGDGLGGGGLGGGGLGGGEVDRWWASIGGRSYSLGPGGALGDPDGAYRAWFDRLAGDTALVRPDGYLYGVATGPGSRTRLAESLRSTLGGEGMPA